MSQTASLEIIPIKKIFENIENQEPIEYSNARIIGDFDLEDYDAIYSKIKIDNSIIEGSLNFNNIKFKREVSFEKVHFNQNVKCISSYFEEKLNIRSSVFDKQVHISAIFYKDVDFKGTKFENAYFYNSRFMGNVSFSKSWFLRESYFKKTKFIKKAIYGSSYFRSEVAFDESIFFEMADFNRVLFGEDVSFNSSRFNDEVTFLGSFFGRDTDFNKTVFYKNAHFEQTLFSNSVSLSEIEFKKIYIPWNSLEKSLIFDKSIILDLISNYENIDWQNDADRCYIYFRDYLRCTRYKNQKFSWNQIFNWSRIYDYIDWLSCQYGIKPFRIIYPSLILILLFGLSFWLGNGVIDNINTTNNKSISSYDSLSSAFLFSIIVFIAKIPTNLRAEGLFLFLAIFEAILGWFVLAIFISSIIEYNKSKSKRR